MGWSGGTYIATAMAESIRRNVESVEVKKKLYSDLYEALINEDWDCGGEAAGIDPVFDEVLKENNEIEDGD